VQAKLRESVSVLDFGATSAGLTAAMASLASGGVVHIPQGTYTFSGGVTCSNSNVTIECDSGANISWTGLGVSVNAITVAANNFTWIGGKITGPSAGAYLAGEKFISMVGTSASVRKTGLTVRNAEMLGFGGYCIYTQFVDLIDVDNNYIHDTGGAGASFLSSNRGKFVNNVISTIALDSGSNAYGVSLTHDSTGYVGGGKAAANPFCWSWVVTNNEVSNINWEGIDTHGAYEILVANNRVYATKFGIALSGSSGAAINYAGYQNICIGNVIDARNRDGSLSGYENTGQGINIAGGTTLHQISVVCSNNILNYKGIISNTSSGAIQASLLDGFVISSNTMDMWGGQGIYYAGGSSGVIVGNVIGGMASAADTAGNCIKDDTGTGSVSITGNKHLALTGNLATVGFRQAAAATKRAFLSANDFYSASYPLITSTGTNFISGNQRTSYISETTTSATIDVSALQGGRGVVQLSNAGTYSITNLTNAEEGQIVTLENIGAGTITFTRSNARLAGSVAAVLNQYSTLTLKLSGSQWIQVSSSLTNG
jgi:hypothetical protein